MSWTILPEEIKLHVVQYLDREDYKGLRLTSRANAQLLGPYLFETVHLSPNTRSFDRARAVAASRFAKHVRSLVYHVRLLANYGSLRFFEIEFMRLNSHPRTRSIPVDVLWIRTCDLLPRYHCALEETAGQEDFRRRDEDQELRELCRHFTALDSISLPANEDDYYTPSKHFIGRRTGLSCLTFSRALHAASLFDAVTDKPLTTICSSEMSWDDLSRISKRLLKAANLKNMKKLAVRLASPKLLFQMPPSHGLRDLDDLLGACMTSNPYTLELDFKVFPHKSFRDDLHGISQTIFKHHWPKLETLALRGICATEDDLRRFLYKHRTTLRSLSLGDIGLLTQPLDIKDPDGSYTVGSFVGLFQWINENLSLRLACLRECFGNYFDENWIAYVRKSEDDDTSIRRHIESWLSHQSVASPVPPEVLVMCSIDGRSIDAAMVEKWSDDSWAWHRTLQQYDPFRDTELFRMVDS